MLGENSNLLILYMFGAKHNKIQLPVKYTCKCPELICIPKEINLTKCFLHKKYFFEIVLKNVELVSGIVYCKVKKVKM